MVELDAAQGRTANGRARPRPVLRVALGVGDAELERRLLPDLTASDELRVVERCLSAEHLLRCVREGRVDAALVGHDLHRLGGGILGELGRSGVPLVVLAPPVETERWRAVAAAVLPPSTDGAAVRRALEGALRGERRPRPSPSPPPTGAVVEAPPRRAATAPSGLAVLALASGHGSPGRTTVAVSLGVALGAVAPTVVVDADCSGPSVHAFLDANPTHNLYMLAHAEPRTAGEWDRALAHEAQPLGPRSPQGMALCGVPKLAMRGAVSPAFLERLVEQLRRRYRYVVLDLGAELAASDLAVHRAAVTLADRVLFVAAPDLVGLLHARAGLALCRTHLGLPAERLALVINGHDPAYHNRRAEIESTLRTPAAALVPHDRRAAQQAIADQRPLVLDRRSPAARALVDLAGRVHGGRVLLPPEPGAGPPLWRRLAVPFGRRAAAPVTRSGGE